MEWREYKSYSVGGLWFIGLYAMFLRVFVLYSPWIIFYMFVIFSFVNWQPVAQGRKNAPPDAASLQPPVPGQPAGPNSFLAGTNAQIMLPPAPSSVASKGASTNSMSFSFNGSPRPMQSSLLTESVHVLILFELKFCTEFVSMYNNESKCSFYRGFDILNDKSLHLKKREVQVSNLSRELCYGSVSNQMLEILVQFFWNFFNYILKML